MGREVNLLRSIPRTKRNIQARQYAKSPEVIAISKKYGELYFDGPRDYGYGGYHYDGRWKPVAVDIIKHFSLRPNDRFLDVGCAKGFLVKELVELGIDAVGIDISEYAIANCHPDIAERVRVGTVEELPFIDGSFAAVTAIDVVHNLTRDRAAVALREIQRVSGGKAFVRVDSYITPEQKAVFESWVLTAEFHDYPAGWLQLFAEAGYSGDYCWVVIE
jgi:ubiquinone/menaquinone biosynthesis C-methylase UbiE